MAEVVRASWERCRRLGVDRERHPARAATDDALRARLVSRRDLVVLAAPHLAWLSDQLASIAHAFCVVDADGVVLETTGNSMDLFLRRAMAPGCDRSEAAIGTNAAGTALVEGRAVIVRGTEHYNRWLHDATCAGAPVRDPDGAVIGAVALATDVEYWRPAHFVAVAHAAYAISRELVGLRDRRLAEAAARRLADLQRYTAALAAARTSGEVTALAAEHAAGTVGAAACWLYLLSPDGTALELSSSVGLAPEEAARFRRVPVDAESGVGMAVRTREPVYVESYEDWTRRFPRVAAASSARSGARALLPLIADGRTHGAMALIFDAWRTIPGVDRDFLDAVAGQCAQALDRALLTEREERRRAAEAAVAAREELLSIAVHDLKNPLASLRLELELVRRALSHPEPSPARALEEIDRGARTIARMVALVHDLLDASHAAAGRLHVAPEPLALDAFARDVAARLGEQLEEAGCALTLDAAGDLEGHWDPVRLEQIFQNLLGNAVKYGHGHPIEVVLRGEGERVRLAVRDHGMGIPDDALGLIFERYERATGTASRGSFGLGLWIVRRIVDALGGHVSVESAEGQGSTFIIVLPRAVAPVAADRLAR